MYYEINVSRKHNDTYYHYFATAPRSFTDLKSTKKAIVDFMLRFPAPEFKITIEYNPEQGTVYTDPQYFLDMGLSYSDENKTK